MLAVIHSDRADSDERPVGMGRCRIEPPSKACLQNEPIQGAGVEMDQGRGDELFERRQVVLLRQRLKLLQALA